MFAVAVVACLLFGGLAVQAAQAATPGDLAFGTPQAYAVPEATSYAHLAYGDFTGDGIDDAAYVTLGAQLRLFPGLPGGGFGDSVSNDPVIPAGWGGSSGVGAGDFDGDGDLDLAISWGDHIRLLFQAAGSLGGEIDVDANVSTLRVADVTGDGLADLIVSRWASVPHAELHVLTNNGDGTFDDLLISDPTVDTWPVAVADLTDDGLIDIGYNVNTGPGIFKIAAQQPSGGFVTSTPGIANVQNAGDVNGDGREDLFAQGSTDLHVWEQQPGGTFEDSQPVPGASGAPLVADMNGDGANDLVFVPGSWYSPTYVALADPVDGSFARTCAYQYGPQAWDWSLRGDAVIADVTADGKPDILSADAYRLSVSSLTSTSPSSLSLDFSGQNWVGGSGTLSGHLFFSQGCVQDRSIVFDRSTDGGTTWTPVDTVKTSANGNFSLPIQDDVAGIISYRATSAADGTHAGATATTAVAVSKVSSTITLTADPYDPDLGEDTVLHGHLDVFASTANLSVGITDTVGGVATELGPVPVDPLTGDFELAVPAIRRMHAFVSHWSGDATYAEQSAYAYAEPRIDLFTRMKGPHKQKDGVAIYSPHGVVIYTVRASPPDAANHVWIALMQKKGAQWRALGEKKYRLNSKGQVAIGIPASYLVPGRMYRFDTWHPGGHELLDRYSDWLYFEVKG